ncbi:hypothetical protein ACO0LM_01465 [Undibacterium sp. Di26W]|uniref:hypothetical protein n=1 Tax=Undibacterium sp. Di26W TaxID=3413035 RepID=UPI003BF07AC5
MNAPTLDFRDAAQFYAQALTLAQAYVPQWSGDWPDAIPSELDVERDPGLVLLHLFANLAAYTAGIENEIPEQRRRDFFQFMNMQLRAPLAAQAPLHFRLKAGQAPQAVPTQCAVLSAARQDIRFQTNAPLQVLPAELCAALSVMPAQDRFIDVLAGLRAGPGDVPVFVAGQASDPAERPLGHWFIMGDPALFKPDDALQSVTITLVGKQLFPEYFANWYDGALTPLDAELSGVPGEQELVVTLTKNPQAAALTIAQLAQALHATDGASPTVVHDQAQYWLLVKPARQVKVLRTLMQQLPVVTGVRCTFRGKTILPQQAAHDLVLLDIANGVFPFGETPQQNDAFYLRSDSVFAKTGALVTINFKLTTLARTFPVRLVWQFWDGRQWESFNETSTDATTHQFADTSNNFQSENADGPTAIQFACPRMGRCTVAGAAGLWIRCKIAEGGYGKLGGIAADGVGDTIGAIPDSILTVEQKNSVSHYLDAVAGVNFSYTITHSNYFPPFIESASIDYSYAAQPQSFWSDNAFALRRFLYSPFKPVEDVFPGFYFAFAPAGFAEKSVGQKLTLYFHLAQEQAQPGRGLEWEYHDGQAWQALLVDDGSYALSRSGVVAFTIPAAMKAADLFSQTAYWFRIIHRHVEHTIGLLGIYPNTVMASNVTTISDQVLGSSNAQQGQKFTLNATPVLPTLVLKVIEPSGFVTAATVDEDGPAGVADSTAEDVPRVWSRVDTFAFSRPTDRSYTLDYQNGIVTFGDGVNGMIPPSGHNNVLAFSYDTTQGLAGNVPAGELTVLRPGIANIAGVSNPAPAAGGVGCASVAELAATSPALIRAGGVAVQLEDFTALAAAASAQVAQARAIETPDHRIRIALLAKSADARPYAGVALLEHVASQLKSACLAPLAERITTESAAFIPVTVTAQLSVAVAADQLLALQEHICAELRAWLHPVSGGPSGQGWTFGQAVLASAAHVWLHRIPAVKAVLSLSLNGRQDGEVVLAPNELPVAGSMLVHLSLA